MKKTIQLTPEWVLERVPHTHYADGDGNISVYTDDTLHASLIELALEVLQLSFDTFDFIDDDNDLTIEFIFRIDDIMDGCPTYYHKMKELNRNNKNYKNSLKN
ncbi:MAG: hypothetical protein JXA68_04625 [Ignavibacteriales bacterium]|nr:hypothetical protein [Ignavibacteriales bacterium]